MTDLNQSQIDALVILAQCPATMVAVHTAHLKALLLEVVRRRLSDDAEPFAAVSPTLGAIRRANACLADCSVNPDGCPTPVMP